MDVIVGGMLQVIIVHFSWKCWQLNVICPRLCLFCSHPLVCSSKLHISRHCFACLNCFETFWFYSTISEDKLWMYWLTILPDYLLMQLLFILMFIAKFSTKMWFFVNKNSNLWNLIRSHFENFNYVKSTKIRHLSLVNTGAWPKRLWPNNSPALVDTNFVNFLSTL